MIRLTDPGNLGPVLAELRREDRTSRKVLADRMTASTGKPSSTIVRQLGTWEQGENAPTVTSLGPWLHALGYDLALVPREDA